MAITIQHMFEGIRPFDWLMLVIEALVLMVIILAEIAGWMRRRAERRKRIFIDEAVSGLSRFLDRGQRLQTVVPDPSPMLTNLEALQRWKAEVKAWADETDLFLAGKSPRASSAFMSIEDSVGIDTFVRSCGRGFYLTGETLEHYKRMVGQLENLRRIIERPEAYF